MIEYTDSGRPSRAAAVDYIQAVWQQVHIISAAWQGQPIAETRPEYVESASADASLPLEEMGKSIETALPAVVETDLADAAGLPEADLAAVQQGILSRRAEALYRQQSQNLNQAVDELPGEIQALPGRQQPDRSYPSAFVTALGSRTVGDVGLTVMTRDGDQVVIEIGFNQEQEQLQYRIGDAGRIQKGTEISYLMDNYGTIAIQGELDQGELDALSDLIGRIASLADTFYSGDFQQAFTQAMDLEFQTDTLSGFTLDMQYETSRYATLVESGTSPAATALQGPEQTPARPDFSAMLQDFRTLITHPAVSLFDDPVTLIDDLFQNITDQIKEIQPSPVFSFSERFRGLLEQAVARF